MRRKRPYTEPDRIKERIERISEHRRGGYLNLTEREGQRIMNYQLSSLVKNMT